jgi:DNA-binding MarR family transcriptional regulator
VKRRPGPHGPWKNRTQTFYPQLARRSPANRCAKLTEDDVLELRAIYNAGDITMTELGEVYGVSKNTVQVAIRGRAWRHI